MKNKIPTYNIISLQLILYVLLTKVRLSKNINYLHLENVYIIYYCINNLYYMCS